MAQEEKSLFIPDSDIERKYKEQVNILLKSKNSKFETIDMGRLPEVYTALGITDKQLKTNGKTLLKALGIEGKNKHNVPKETIENLLSLTYDPEAVFKSLSISNNPDAYISVLNAKTEKQEQVIAILSPSRDGHGFTFIPSVYEKHNFERFLGKIKDEQKILYIKNKGSQLWGQLQSLPRHNQEPSTKNILSKDDIVKRFNEKYQIKEKTMAEKIYKDFWIKDDNVVFHSERFNHDFSGSEVSFGLDRMLNKENDPLLISICESFKRVVGDEIVTLRFEDDIASAKKMIDASIKVFDQKQNVNIYQIKDYFSFYMEQQNNQRNAAAFVEYFDHDQANKMPKQGETPPPERRNINSKEKTMSDKKDPAQIDDYLDSLKGNVLPKNSEAEAALSPREEAFKKAVSHAAYQRKVVADAVKNGTLCCLPGKDGYADTAPAVNIMTPNKPYHGENLLFLKAFQKQEQNGFPTAEYVTYHQIDKAREEGVDLYVRKGQKGVSLIISEEKNPGEWEDKDIRLFNVAQLNNPKAIKEWAGKKIEEQERKDLEYKQTQYGAGYKPPEPKPKEPGPEIVCSSTEPEKYLGQYLAAVSMGSKFKASPEQAAEFSEKMVKALYAPMESRVDKETGDIKPPPLNRETGQPITDVFSLEKISRKANQECVEFMRDLKMQAQKQNQPEQKQEQTQSVGKTW